MTTCDLKCVSCARYSDCGLRSSYSKEVQTALDAMRVDRNDIAKTIEDFDLTGINQTIDEWNQEISNILKQSSSDSFKSISDTTKILGIPNTSDSRDDLRRLAALGMVTINGVAYVAGDDNNVSNLRILYKALGRDWEKLVAALFGDYGRFFKGHRRKDQGQCKGYPDKKDKKREEDLYKRYHPAGWRTGARRFFER